METKESEDLEKTQRKSRVISASDQQNIDNEPVEVKPELLPEKETSQADQDIQDKEPHSHSPIKRNSIFNRSIRRKSKAKARDTPERNASCLADSQDNGKSVNESLTLNIPCSRMPPWRTAVQTGPGAQKMSPRSQEQHCKYLTTYLGHDSEATFGPHPQPPLEGINRSDSKITDNQDPTPEQGSKGPRKGPGSEDRRGLRTVAICQLPGQPKMCHGRMEMASEQEHTKGRRWLHGGTSRPRSSSWPFCSF
ncbi:ephexin-1-like isoform X2 [Macaca thibetana thibetana]|uniref:ephexin-1-like isoform X2 n=1 Tax=Macaca thibetana thibetana TaxID=257877 RepID=UPI0021BCC4ED|nr:ephexin-1-like isoform X2 [Macaca thibetana thibetana]